MGFDFSQESVPMQDLLLQFFKGADKKALDKVNQEH